MTTSYRMRALVGVAAAGALLLAGCSSSAEPGGGGGSETPADDTTPVTLDWVGYGGAGQDGMIEAYQVPFTAEHPNVTFTNTSPPDPAQVKAQVLSGQVDWDVVITAPYLADQNCDTLYEPLDVPDVDQSQFEEGLLGKCHIPNFQYGLIFAYDGDKWPDPATAPSKLADFFDTKKFPGKRGIVPTVQDGFLEIGLLADGVRPDDLYPLDVDRSLSVWDTVKADTIFAANPGALLQALTSKQADMWILVQARSQTALDEGVNLVPVWDKTVTSVDGIAIPKGAPHKAITEKLFSFILSPEAQADVASRIGVAPVNSDAKPKLTANGEKVNAFGDANTGERIRVDAKWWGENYNEVSARVTTWLNG